MNVGNGNKTNANEAAATRLAQSMLESSLSPLVSPLIHNLNLPLLDVLGLGACPGEGGEAKKKTAVSHGGDATMQMLKNDRPTECEPFI